MAEQLPLPGLGNQLSWAAVAEKIGEQTGLAAFIASVIGLPIGVDLVKNPAEHFFSHKIDWLGIATQATADIEQDVGHPLFAAIVDAGLGFNLSDQSGEAATAVKLVERAIGFGAIMPLLTAGVAGILEARMGSHAPTAMLESIKGLGNDLGINFFLGQVLGDIFETASAPPIREAISRQTRPARLDYREIRALLKAHALQEPQARDQLRGVGYTEADIDLLYQLDRVWLNTGELSNEFMHGRLSEADLDSYMDSLGYVPEDRDRLKQQWQEQAESSGAVAFRDVMRRGVLEGHLSQDQYITAMRQIYMPEAAIQLDVAALQRELEWGRIQVSVGQVKQFFQKGEYSDTQAVQELINGGYDLVTANALIKDWSTVASKTKAGIGIARILSYELSGVLSHSQAYSMLTEQGLSIQLASLLSTNPSQYGGLIKHDRTPQTLIAAFKEDVITSDELRQQLLDIGTDQREVDYMVRVAIAQKTRSQKPRQVAKHLTDAQVIDAAKYGLATMAWGVRELETLGWSEADAQLIIATEKTKLSGQVPADWSVLT